MKKNTHTFYTHIMLLILAGVLLLSSIVGYIVSQRMQVQDSSRQSHLPSTPLMTNPSPITPTLIPYPTKGSFVLKEQSGLTSAQIGESFTFDLIATSDEDTIAGYDVIISYDHTAFDRPTTQNKLDSFRLFTYDRTTHESISATKNLEVTDSIQFSNTPLLSLTFIAKKPGVYFFSLKPVAKESSKLVNESAQVLYPESTDFRLEIK